MGQIQRENAISRDMDTAISFFHGILVNDGARQRRQPQLPFIDELVEVGFPIGSTHEFPNGRVLEIGQVRPMSGLQHDG